MRRRCKPRSGRAVFRRSSDARRSFESELCGPVQGFRATIPVVLDAEPHIPADLSLGVGCVELVGGVVLGDDTANPCATETRVECQACYIEPDLYRCETEVGQIRDVMNASRRTAVRSEE